MKRIFPHVAPIFDAKAGARLAKLRNQKNLSQVELSKMLGLSQSTVSKLEAGTLKNSGIPLDRFEKVFGDDVLFILTGDPAHSSRAKSE